MGTGAPADQTGGLCWAVPLEDCLASSHISHKAQCMLGGEAVALDAPQEWKLRQWEGKGYAVFQEL